MVMIVVVMGVTGAGKSTIGKLLAERLGARFVEGDDHHPRANVEKMSAGTPLDDDDRWPWLDELARIMAEHAAQSAPVVVTCSALKRRYRDRLRAQVPRLRFVLLTASRERLTRRLRARAGHFMPPALLESQLASLELPDADECVHVLDGERAPDVVIADAVSVLAAREHDG